MDAYTSTRKLNKMRRKAMSRLFDWHGSAALYHRVYADARQW